MQTQAGLCLGLDEKAIERRTSSDNSESTSHTEILCFCMTLARPLPICRPIGVFVFSWPATMCGQLYIHLYSPQYGW